MPKGFATLRTNVTATVRFFNAAKGYGFVQPEDGGAEAFLPAAVLAQSGHAAPSSGDVVLCDLKRGPKGPQVAALYEVHARGDRHEGGARAAHGPRAAAPAAAATAEGTVKWFDAARGFGFVALDGGGKDAFVHARALARSGLSDLAGNQRVRLTLRSGPKGLQAERLELL